MSDANDDDDQEKPVKKTKHRSPNYPMVGLRKAVERARQLYEKYRRAPVPINLAQELWTYTPHGSSGNQAVAALKAYGLLDVEGDGTNRRVRVTEAAYRIVLGSPDKADLLRRAALNPPLYRELWDRYGGEEFSTELVRHYLLFDREGGKFNPEVVDSFIENLNDSLRFGGLLRDGENSGNVGDIEEDEAVSLPTNTAPATGPKMDAAMVAPTRAKFDPPAQYYGAPSGLKPGGEHAVGALPEGIGEDSYDIPGAGRVVLRWPDKLNADMVDELEDWFKLIIRKMRRTVANIPQGRLVPITMIEAGKTTAPLIPGGSTGVLKVEGFPDDD